MTIFDILKRMSDSMLCLLMVPCPGADGPRAAVHRAQGQGPYPSTSTLPAAPRFISIDLRPDGLLSCPYLCPQGLEFDRVALADDLVRLVRDEEDMIMMADNGHFFNPQQARPDPEVRCFASMFARTLLMLSDA